MEKDTAEIVVKVYAVLAWIGAAISALAALGILFFSSVAGGSSLMMGNLDSGMMGGVFAALGVVFAIFLLALAVFEVFVGIGLWKHQPWSRIATIVVSVLNLFSFPIGTIIGGIGIWLFGFDETVKSLFSGSAPADKKKQ